MLPEVGPCLPAGPDPAFRIQPQPDAIRALRGCIDPTELGMIDPFRFLKLFKGSEPSGLGPAISGIPHLCPPCVGLEQDGYFKSPRTALVFSHLVEGEGSVVVGGA